MTKNWLRMINAAQRVVTIESPRTTNMPGLQSLRLDIQGIRVVTGGPGEFWSYAAMAEMGLNRGWAKPLTVWQRLRREQAPIGWLDLDDTAPLRLSFWSPSPLTLEFDLDHAEDAVLWRESEIMVMSAGFHFLTREKA